MSIVIMPQLYHINNKCSFYSFAEEMQNKLDNGYTIGCGCVGNLCGGPIVTETLKCISTNQMDVYEKYKIREISKFNCKLSNVISNSFDTMTYTFNLEEMDMIGGLFELLSAIIIGFLLGWGIHSLIRKLRR
jgi:hypothetical protein